MTAQDNLNPQQFPVNEFNKIQADDYGIALHKAGRAVRAADRTHGTPDRLSTLQADIAENGIKEPLTVLNPRPDHPNEKPRLVGGHHRAVAAMNLGLESVPIQFHEPVRSEHSGAYVYPTWGA